MIATRKWVNRRRDPGARLRDRGLQWSTLTSGVQGGEAPAHVGTNRSAARCVHAAQNLVAAGRNYSLIRRAILSDIRRALAAGLRGVGVTCWRPWKPGQRMGPHTEEPSDGVPNCRPVWIVRCARASNSSRRRGEAYVFDFSCATSARGANYRSHVAIRAHLPLYAVAQIYRLIRRRRALRVVVVTRHAAAEIAQRWPARIS